MPTTILTSLFARSKNLLDILFSDGYFKAGTAPVEDTRDERGMSVATVTKAELARILARDISCTEVLAHKAVDAFFEIMREAILQGNRVEIRDFGSWTVKATNAKPNARNPRTGKSVCVPARRKVAFKPGRVIKEALTQPLDTLQEEECHGTAITR